MGVDYSAHYGLGYQVTVPEFDESHDFYGDERGYLDEVLKEEYLQYFTVGDDCYTGSNQDSYYVILVDPFKDGFEKLEEKAIKLKELLILRNLTPTGDFDVVGGLEIW